MGVHLKWCRERFANKPADDEGAGHIEDFPEACARSEEP